MEKFVKLTDVIKLIDADIERCNLCLKDLSSECADLRPLYVGHKNGLNFLKHKLQNP